MSSHSYVIPLMWFYSSVSTITQVWPRCRQQNICTFGFSDCTVTQVCDSHGREDIHESRDVCGLFILCMQADHTNRDKIQAKHVCNLSQKHIYI